MLKIPTTYNPGPKVVPTLFISLKYIGQMKMFHVTHTLHLQSTDTLIEKAIVRGVVEVIC
jgi:hypothetical protein